MKGRKVKREQLIKAIRFWAFSYMEIIDEAQKLPNGKLIKRIIKESQLDLFRASGDILEREGRQ